MTQRLESALTKKELISKFSEATIKVLNIISRSSESPQSKEELAKYMKFIFNVIDIEKECLRFDELKKCSIRKNKYARH